MTVDDVVETIFRRLCIRQQTQGPAADMSLVELRLALGVREEDLMAAVRVLRLADDLHVEFTARDRVKLGVSWRGRCEGVPPM